MENNDTNNDSDNDVIYLYTKPGDNVIVIEDDAKTDVADVVPSASFVQSSLILNKNKGLGAGGSNTNVHGLSFEQKTNNEERLLSLGFIKQHIPGKTGKTHYYLEKMFESSPTQLKKRIVYVTQGGFKAYVKAFYQKDVNKNPDEAYLIQYYNDETAVTTATTTAKITVKILEKKSQQVSGSADVKLMCVPGYIYMYQRKLGDNFNVQYALCLNNYLKQQYLTDPDLMAFNLSHQIPAFYGDDDDYWVQLDNWLAR